MDKLHAELDELHKLNYKIVKFDKLNSKLFNSELAKPLGFNSGFERANSIIMLEST